MTVACRNMGVIRELIKFKCDQIILDNNGQCAKNLSEDPEIINLINNRVDHLLEVSIMKGFDSSQHILLRCKNTSIDQQAKTPNIEPVQDEKYCVLVYS